jgi:hypothetical protein
MDEANNSVMAAKNELALLLPQLQEQQKELREAKKRLRIDHERSTAEINKAKADKLEAQTLRAGAIKYASDTNKALANSNDELARQADAAKRLRHQNDGIQAITAARENLDLNGVVLAFREAQLAGDLALSRVNKSDNIVQRATRTAEDQLSRLFLQNTLCIRGYFQSFVHFPDKSMNLALDQAGYYYNDTISSECPTSPRRTSSNSFHSPTPAPSRQAVPRALTSPPWEQGTATSGYLRTASSARIPSACTSLLSPSASPATAPT